MWVGSDEDGPSVDRSAVLQFPLEEYPERNEWACSRQVGQVPDPARAASQAVAAVGRSVRAASAGRSMKGRTVTYDPGSSGYPLRHLADQ